MRSNDLANQYYRKRAKARLRWNWSILALCGIVIVYILVFATIALLRYRALGTRLDMALYDQTLWNTARGRWLAYSLQPGRPTKLADHFQPTLLPLAALYLLPRSTEIFLIFTVVVVASGALPLFWLARRELEDALVALVLAAAYLLYPATVPASLPDFHAVDLVAPLFLWALYCLITKRYPLFFTLIILAMGCREDIAPSVATIGMYAAFVLKRRKVGYATIALSAAWLGATLFIFIPYFSPQNASPHLGIYENLGDNPLAIAETVLTQPRFIAQTLFTREKFAYVFQLLLPLAFLPLLSPRTIWLVLPALGVNLLSARFYMYNATSYYVVPLIPFLFFSGIYGARLMLKLRSSVGLAMVIAVASLSSFPDVEVPTVTAHHRLVDKLIVLIPPDAGVVSQFNVLAHLTHRERIFTIPYMSDEVDFVFLDVTAYHRPFGERKDYTKYVMNLLHDGEFGVRAAEDGYFLLERGAPQRHYGDNTLPPEFYTFAHAGNPQIQYPMEVAFGDALQLLGYNIRVDDHNHLALRTYWRVTQAPNRDYSMDFRLHDAAGAVQWAVGADLPFPWYPPSLWQVGETIQVDSRYYALEHLGTGYFTLRVSDSADDSLSLPPRVISSAYYLPAPDYGTALRLLEFQCDPQDRDNALAYYRDKILGRNPHCAAVPRLRQFTAPAITYPLRVNFGARVTLLGYDSARTSWRAGETLSLTLHWQAAVAPLESYQVFVHALDAEGTRRWQADGAPVNGSYPTSRWAAGEVVADPRHIPIPASTPTGTYTLLVGVYELDTMQRLSILSAEGARTEDDAVFLTIVTVRGESR